jgi:hypothetical protein
MPRLSRYDILSSAFRDAINDRKQTAVDNEQCAPEHAKELLSQAEAWVNLQSTLLPANPMDARLSFEALRELSKDEHDALCDVLYFAAIARLALIDSQKDTRTSVSVDRQYRQRYMNLLSALSGPVEERNFVTVPTRDVAALIPEDQWEETEDGGKVFRPRLPQ